MDDEKQPIAASDDAIHSIRAQRARNVLAAYRAAHPNIHDWSIATNSASVIETGWFNDHRGEIVLKIHIDVSVSPPDVLVLQKVSWLGIFKRAVHDSEWALKVRDEIMGQLDQLAGGV